MKYKGREVTEADGKDYKLGMTPKRMLVWNSDSCNDITVDREVLGFFHGRWIAVADIGTGVCEWKHAAEIPTQSVRPFKSAEELDKAVIVHGPFVINVTTGTRMIISSYDNTSIRDHDNAKTMADMVNKFTFLDGAPFGVEEG